MNLTDVVLILILIFIACHGASRGFFKSLAGVVSYVAAAFVSKFCALPAAESIYSSYVQAKVLDALTSVFPTGSVDGEINSVLEQTAEALPGYAGAALKYFSHDNTPAPDSVLTVTQIESTYISPMLTKVLSWIAAAVIFLLCALLLRVVFTALDKMLFKRKNPGILSWVNKMLGFLLGAVKGTLLIIAACLVLNLLVPLIGENAFADNISASVICSFVSQII